MKKAIVIHPMVQCMINRNLCQKVADYLELNGIRIVSSVQDADYIFFSGCGVLEANEAEGIRIIQYIKKIIENSNTYRKFFLIGCLPKINKVTRGIRIEKTNNLVENYVIESEFSMSEDSQFVIIDNYDYSLLDKIIGANIKFENVQYPNKISAQNGLQQMKFCTMLTKARGKEKGNKQQKSYIDLIKLQVQVTKTGFLFPASNDYLLIYGFRQIIIGYGCKNNCAYCAVKFAKNKIKSVTLENILFQIKSLIEKGEKKFVLIADDFGSWGIDLKCDWTELIREINKIDCPDMELAIFNIKAEDILDHKDVVDQIVNNGKLKYLCVMSQHVNKKILRLMKRKIFSKDEFVSLINEYGNKGVQIETFTIVGFPGETNVEFQELVEFVCSIETPHFANYSTPFSLRYGTEAYSYENRIPKNEIIERVKEIDDKYIESSRKRFSILPGSLQKSLYEMLCLLKEHEINYDDLNMNN